MRNEVKRMVLVECPVCGKKHEVEELTDMAETIIKGDLVKYSESFFRCANAKDGENEFEYGAMVNRNLLNARNAYRQIHGLLTSDEIIGIRKAYGLSQVELAKLLGWGEATVARYESKAIQDDAYDAMLRLVKDDPMMALGFLKKNEDKFDAARFVEIRENIKKNIASYGTEYLARQSLLSQYVDYETPSDSNGQTTLDIDKIEAIISYYASNVPNLFKTKLMKMLWYADALYYKRNGHAITGLVYCHDKHGALPIGHYEILNLSGVNVKEEFTSNIEPMYHFYPCDSVDCSVLNAAETSVLDAVTEKFRNYKAGEIVDYMHKETAYTKTEMGDIIPFSLAAQIREF